MQERRWWYIREGRPWDYHGVAVHPRHLSWWEIFVLRVHEQYNPELDRQQKENERAEAKAARLEEHSARVRPTKLIKHLCCICIS